MLCYLPSCVSVSACVLVLFCFVFRGRKTNPGQIPPAFQHLPGLWKPVIPLDRKDFRLDLVSMFRVCQLLRAEREQSPLQKGVSGDSERTARLWAHPCFPSKLTPTPTPIFLSGLKLRPPTWKGSPEVIRWAGGRARICTPSSHFHCSISAADLGLSPR